MLTCSTISAPDKLPGTTQMTEEVSLLRLWMTSKEVSRFTIAMVRNVIVVSSSITASSI
jgi:hypothetical protein